MGVAKRLLDGINHIAGCYVDRDVLVESAVFTPESSSDDADVEGVCVGRLVDNAVDS